MADLLIKNIELPKDGGVLLNISRYGQVAIGYATSRGVSFLPVVDVYCARVPVHGDLIDKNFLLGMLDFLIFTAKQIDQDSTNFELMKNEIENAPVVLASNEETT